jgi:hypothetical protein
MARSQSAADIYLLDQSASVIPPLRDPMLIDFFYLPALDPELPVSIREYLMLMEFT